MANYKDSIPFIQKWEAGLSRAKTDRAASNPSPFTITAKDTNQRGWPSVTAADWHTNKGVTWGTFSSLAPKLGYIASRENWVNMPQNIWGLIFKREYWDKVQGDNLKSQGIANLLADWYWGSGTNAVRNLQQVLNRSFGYKLAEDGVMGNLTLAAANKVDQERLFKLLHEEKIDFYGQIVKNDSSQSANYKGWLNRANELYTLNKGKIAVAGGGLFFFLLAAVAVYKRNDIKEWYTKKFN